jgi:hypothetical protein
VHAESLEREVGLRPVNNSWLKRLGARRRGETDLIVPGEPQRAGRKARRR